MWFKDKYFYSVRLLCVCFPPFHTTPLYLSIQNPCHFFLSWANTELVFIVVSIFTSFLWCHVCSLPALLYVFPCWESWAFVGPRLNILWLESPSITTVRVSGQTQLLWFRNRRGEKETERNMAGTWGLETLHWKVQPAEMYHQAREKIRHSLRQFKMGNLFLLFQIHCKSCKGKTYHFTGAFFLRKVGMRKDFHSKKIARSDCCAISSNKMNIIITRVVNNQHEGLTRERSDWLELIY